MTQNSHDDCPPADPLVPRLFLNLPEISADRRLHRDGQSCSRRWIQGGSAVSGENHGTILSPPENKKLNELPPVESRKVL